MRLGEVNTDDFLNIKIARLMLECPDEYLKATTPYNTAQRAILRSWARYGFDLDQFDYAIRALRAYAAEQLDAAGFAPEPDTDPIKRYYRHLSRQDAAREAARMRAEAVRERRRELRQLILWLGGIGPSRHGDLATEYRHLPRSVKRKSGPPLDDVALSISNLRPDMGIETTRDLLEEFL